MKRFIIIVSCLAVLSCGILVIWVYMNRTEQDNPFTPKGIISNGQSSNDSLSSTENAGMDPHLFELPVRVALLGNDQFSPGYFDLANKTFYRWKDIVLRPEQVPDVYSSLPSRMRILDVKKFDLADVPVEVPVKYWYWEDGDEYRAGYLDRSARAFYAWKGIVLNKQELLDNSQSGQVAIANPDKVSQVLDIDMPAHLKEHPELWKKGGAYTPETRIRAEKRAAEKKAAERQAVEKRAREPRAFQLLVRITDFGENKYSPCYEWHELKHKLLWHRCLHLPHTIENTCLHLPPSR